MPDLISRKQGLSVFGPQLLAIPGSKRWRPQVAVYHHGGTDIVAKDRSIGDKLDGLTHTVDIDSGIGFVAAIDHTPDLGFLVPDWRRRVRA